MVQLWEDLEHRLFGGIRASGRDPAAVVPCADAGGILYYVGYRRGDDARPQPFYSVSGRQYYPNTAGNRSPGDRVG